MSTLQGESFYFHHGWHFLRADAFPMAKAVDAHRDAEGHAFYEADYRETGWQPVTLPHTFNDEDLFRDRIQDGGSGQRRTAAFYRNILTIPARHKNHKVLLAFEGLRQTCYLYVNGTLAGYYEAGVAPFGFDITPYVRYDAPNLIAIATDNTATRNAPFCIAETPNKPDAVPGSYLFPQEQAVPADRVGVPFFWNCNDFNPSVGGITRPVQVFFKPDVYLTLPLYSNLQTKGLYVYGRNFDLDNATADIRVEAEVRNEGKVPVSAQLRITLRRPDGSVAAIFDGAPATAAPTGRAVPPLSITPADAYIPDEAVPGHYRPVEDESLPAPTATDSMAVTVLHAGADTLPLRFWSIDDPYLYTVEAELFVNGEKTDAQQLTTGFRAVSYDKDRGLRINGAVQWLRGYAQRAANEWAAIGIAPEWLHDEDAALIRESNANHIRFMHVAGSPADVRAFDRRGIVCTQPAGDKEKESFGRQWDQRVELMRDVIIAFRNHPSILFWEAGNNSISREHMREMRLLKQRLDPHGGRFMGCRTLNTEEVVNESEYVGTMLNRHAARFLSQHGPVTETEYSREEAPRRIWDDFTPPDFDYRNRWVGKGGKKAMGYDFYDLTSEDLALENARGYAEFFNDRMGGASGKNYYSACAALCWTDSAQHGRQSYSENARMSGRVDPCRTKKQSFDYFRVMQSEAPAVKIIGHWNYPAPTAANYRYEEKRFNGTYWEGTGVWHTRDPHHKTVYVVASYPVAAVELLVNGRRVGRCDKPQNTFVFAFPGVDVTQSGWVEAVGYGYDGIPSASDRLETADSPAALRLTLHTAPGGLAADGADIAYVDIAVQDSAGRVCPLCDARIDFTLDGPAQFLGGYNSGRFAGYGHDDSVIHQNHVYAECGTNRVFLRAGTAPGTIRLTAVMGSLRNVITLQSKPADLSPLTAAPLPCRLPDYAACAPQHRDAFVPIPQADAAKYQPEDKCYTKILVNGQEPDTRGVRSVNENGRVWGAVLCILERLQTVIPDAFRYDWNAAGGCLTLHSGGHTVTAQVGVTHLLVDGKENLMDGQPYLTAEGALVMEVNALIPHITGTRTQYDDKVNVLRIETE